VLCCAPNDEKAITLRTLHLFISLNLALCLTLPTLGAEVSPAAQAAPSLSAETPVNSTGLALASTNTQMLLEVAARQVRPLAPAAGDPSIARLVSRILVQYHYNQQPLDDSVSSKFLDRYLEVLDNLHMHFLQSDLAEFEKYRTTLDDLTFKGETKPAREIFARFLQRIEQRVRYVADLLENEKFEFTGTDRYNLNRKEAPRPKDLAEAQQIWRQHLRYEILQEKLNKAKPEEIANKITRRYARILRMYQDLDHYDVFEIYLSALTHVFDPHSDYMGKSTLESFSINMNLSLYGIGALLQSEDGYCKIKELVPGGPAAESKKLKPNDRIIMVGQGASEPVDVVDTPLKKVVDLIRGPKGTVVNLTIIPADATDPSQRKAISLVRDEIKLEEQEAKARIIDVPGEQNKTMRLGVIDLPSFYATLDRKGDAEPRSTTVDVNKLLRKLKREKVEGIVLDLRRNGGGSLEEAVNLTGLFIKEGPVVQVRDHDKKPSVDRDTDPTVVYDGPLVVLTSRHSASASEILAGALQDYGRALVVGDSSTHGKGTVQSLMRLDPFVQRAAGRAIENPGAVKLTIRKFYRPSGASTQLKGVVPDMVLPSPNNFAEVGESALENPLPWDTCPSVSFDKLNLIQPLLPELQKRSAARLELDQDFAYLREDIDQYKKMLADKTVSLNEEFRLKETQEREARQKARQAELKGRAETGETAYEITLKLADQPGLPAPMPKTNELAAVTGHPLPGVPMDSIPASPRAVNPTPRWELPGDAKSTNGTEVATQANIAGKDDDDEDPSSTEPKLPPVDAGLKEAKRILTDLINLWPRANSVAATK
jgi:carboxyl-terminal processing protease